MTTLTIESERAVLARLEAELGQLYDQERAALSLLGRARLLGLPGRPALAELQRIREAIESNHAATRVLELSLPRP